MRVSDGQKQSVFNLLLFIPHYVELRANDSVLFTVHTPSALPTTMCNTCTVLDIVTAHGSRLHKNKALKSVPFHSLN